MPIRNKLEKFANINPFCKSEETQYCLKIHHDFSLSPDISIIMNNIGHFYVELYDYVTGQQNVAGKHPAIDGTPICTSKIINEEERLKASIEYSEKNNSNNLVTKVVALLSSQYDGVLSFIKNILDDTYVIFFNDCTDFTQKVYSLAGLPRHFTDVYTSQELKEIGSIAAKSVLFKYGSYDRPITVEGISKDEVALRYNVVKDRVVPLTVDIFNSSSFDGLKFVILSEVSLHKIKALENLSRLNGDNIETNDFYSDESQLKDRKDENLEKDMYSIIEQIARSTFNVQKVFNHLDEPITQSKEDNSIEQAEYAEYLKTMQAQVPWLLDFIQHNNSIVNSFEQASNYYVSSNHLSNQPHSTDISSESNFYIDNNLEDIIDNTLSKIFDNNSVVDSFEQTSNYCVNSNHPSDQPHSTDISSESNSYIDNNLENIIDSTLSEIFENTSLLGI